MHNIMIIILFKRGNNQCYVITIDMCPASIKRSTLTTGTTILPHSLTTNQAPYFRLPSHLPALSDITG